jgi:hypothetical protein
MQSTSVTTDQKREVGIETAFRPIKALVGAYLAISFLNLVAIVLLRNHESLVNSAVWTRGTILGTTAVLMFAFTIRASRGSRRAYLRLRIASAIILVSVPVIMLLPGTFPLWMKIEQCVCGLILLAVVLLVNRKHLRLTFTGKGSGIPRGA